MKIFSDAAKAALAAGDVRTSAAVKILAGDPFLAWGGAGVLTIEAEDYTGIGDAGFVTVSGGQIGGTEDAIALSLSGVEPTVMDLDTTAAARDARTTVWRLMFDGSGQVLLDAQPFDHGRLDKLAWDDTPGAASKLTATVETAARGLGRNTGRLTADADQRMIDAADGSLKRVTQAGQLTLAWGGKPPARAGLALPNVGPAGGIGFVVGDIGQVQAL